MTALSDTTWQEEIGLFMVIKQKALQRGTPQYFFCHFKVWPGAAARRTKAVRLKRSTEVGYGYPQERLNLRQKRSDDAYEKARETAFSRTEKRLRGILYQFKPLFEYIEQRDGNHRLYYRGRNKQHEARHYRRRQSKVGIHIVSI